MNQNLKAKLLQYSDLAIILLGGIFLRWRIILRDELWYDEAFTGILMRLPFAEFLNVTFNDPTPPLYYFLVKFWTAFTRVGDFQLRSLSMIFGVATIVFVYLAAKELFAKQAAVFASALVAISPFFVEYSVEARAYSLYGLVFAVTLYLLAKKRLFFFMLGTIVMLATHYTAIFFIIPMVILYFWIIYENDFSFKKGVIRILPVILAFLLIYSHLSALSDVVSNDWIKEANYNRVPQSVAAHLFGVQTKRAGTDDINELNFILDKITLGWVFFSIYAVGIGVVLYKSKNNYKKEAELVAVVLGALLPQIMIITLSLLTDRDFYVERYLFPSAIFFAIAVGYLLDKLLSFEYVVIFLLAYVFLFTKVQAPPYHFGMRELRDEYISTSKTIVFTSPIDYVVARYYMGDNKVNVRLYDPQNPDNKYSHWQMIPESAHITDLSSAIVVTPNESVLEENQYIQIDNIGSYKIFAKTRY